MRDPLWQKDTRINSTGEWRACLTLYSESKNHGVVCCEQSTSSITNPRFVVVCRLSHNQRIPEDSEGDGDAKIVVPASRNFGEARLTHSQLRSHVVTPHRSRHRRWCVATRSDMCDQRGPSLPDDALASSRITFDQDNASPRCDV